ARREGRAPEAAQRLMGRRMFDPGRRQRVDLFSTFTGALAVQESLQLDTLLGEDDMRRAGFPPDVPQKMAPPPPDVKKSEDKPAEPPPPAKSGSKTASKLRTIMRRPIPKSVLVDTLSGPTIKSHPWEQMLAGRKP